MKKITCMLSALLCVVMLVAQQNVNITVNPETKSKDSKPRSGIVTLYGYLKVIVNELGYFETEPVETINRINNEEQYGYNTWRLPSEDELSMLRANGYASKENSYMTINNRCNGNVILVTDKEKASVLKEREKALRAERSMQEEAERQKRLAKYRDKEKQYIDSLKSLTGWCDLGLPSGTFWSYKSSRRKFTYKEAMWVYGNQIPTRQNWNELISNCRIKKMKVERGTNYITYYIITGKNGNQMIIENENYHLPEVPNEFGTCYYSCIDGEGKCHFYKEGVNSSRYVITISKNKNSEILQFKYVDLGLPSGTKWTNCYYDARNYYYADEDFIASLPRKSQWQELKKYAKWEWSENGYKIIGSNGNYIYLFVGEDEDYYLCRDDEYGSKKIYRVVIKHRKKVKISYEELSGNRDYYDFNYEKYFIVTQ
jgi:hypothetical protein